VSHRYLLKQPQNTPTPSLLLYPDLVERNIASMVSIAGGATRLRPHIKTHKCANIIKMMQQQGINKFKCATIAEAELLAETGATDIILSYQPVGPNVARLKALVEYFPNIKFATLIDNANTVKELSAQSITQSLDVYIDLDVGMHRTGVTPGKALSLLEAINAQKLNFKGWHVYDGHIRNSDFEERKSVCDTAYQSVEQILQQSAVKHVIAGGSPTFPVHALRPQVELSPGTSVLWDFRYQEVLPDLPFVPAAILLTRVISKPAGDLLCLDLGHKAVASEMAHPRVHLMDLEVVEFTNHSEEHLVVRTPQAPDFSVGDVLYAVPMHICPTSALHQEFIVVEQGTITGKWSIDARDRRINF